jgi:hypothetical protein
MTFVVAPIVTVTETSKVESQSMDLFIDPVHVYSASGTLATHTVTKDSYLFDELLTARFPKLKQWMDKFS